MKARTARKPRNRAIPVLAGILLAGSALPGWSQQVDPAGIRPEGEAAEEEAPSPTDTGRSGYELPAMRVEQGPTVDGSLDDAVWATAPLIDTFIQQEPDEGALVSEQTEVRIVYDGSSLFLGITAYDRTPEGILASEMRRDADRILEEDNFQIILDTFMDSRSAYMFVVSPAGAQLDQQVFDEGGRDRRASASAINRDWDGVWDAEARRTDEGWIAEIRIPMVTIRFPDTDPQSWGINLMRNIGRRNEQAFWAPIPQPFGLTRVSLAGTLTGLRALDRGYDLRVKPYVTGGARSQLEGGVTDRSGESDVGLDVKYGVTAGLSLDVTINTDFAQAEVDNEQVNLTRFPLFFPEKREFFLENSGQFAVGTTNSTGRIADLFFSRRIGISASRQQVPIRGGARLTGKVGANNIALMDLQTDDAFGEAGENFLVARYSRDLMERSQVGGLFINKKASSGGRYNRTYAADMTFSPIPSLTIDGFLSGTETLGYVDSSSPGGCRIAEPSDPTGDELRRSCSDVAGHVRVGWLDQSWRIYTEYTDLGDSFNPEVGFVPRVGIKRSKIHFEGNPRPELFGIRMMDPMWNVLYITDQTGRLVSRQIHHMIGTYFDSGASLVFMYNRYFERLDDPFRVTSDVTIETGDYRFWDFRANFRSNPSERFYYNASISPQTFYDGDRLDWNVGVGLRVTDQLATSGSFRRSDVDLPVGAFVADIGSVQLDYALSPTMSLRSITQYNSSADQWSTSARFRYIFRPGSDLYVVYDEVRRDDAIQVSPFVEQFRDRQLIVKMTYLLSM